MIHLHVHSSYSVGDAVGTPEQIVRYAKARKFEGIGISEHGNLASVPRFIRACKKADIQPVIGIEAYFIDGDASSDYGGKKREKHRRDTVHFLMGALNRTGYYNLVKLNNLAHHPDNFYYQPRMDWEMLEEHSEGIWATSACAVGLSSKALRVNRSKKLARRRLRKMQSIFDDNFYVEIQPTDFVDQPLLNEHNIDLAMQLDIPIITTCDVHYPTKAYKAYRDVLLAIRRRQTYKEIKKLNNPTTNWIQDNHEIMDLYGETEIDLGIAEASIYETYELLDKCEDFDITSQAELPRIVKNPNSYIKKKCIREMKKRGMWDKTHASRVKRELRLIIDKGFSNYILIVADIVAFARKSGIAIGPGRGSACGSLVCYLLGITAVNPIEHNLIFERFLSEDRMELPDIDLDIQSDRRPEVIEYFSNKYGNVIDVMNFTMFRVKNAFNDAIRVFEIPEKQSFSDLDPDTIEQFKKMSPEVRRICRKYPNVERVCKALQGNIRNTGKHAGGFVMVDEDEPMPIMNVGGKTSSSWVEGVDYRDLADFGHVKYDLLGTTVLSVIKQCVEETGVNLEEIELDIPEVIAEFAKANTETTFQFNSWGMRRMLRDLQPDSFEDLVAASALIRPGPRDMGTDEEYIARKRGKPASDPWSDYEATEEVLGNTYGILVYQEQLTELASKLAGMSLTEGEILRKEIIKYGKSATHRKENQAAYDALKAKLVDGCVKKGLRRKDAVELWNHFMSFGRYGFNRNHSFPYTLLGYWQMYFQVFHPKEYFFSYVKFESVEENVNKAMNASKDYDIQWLLPCVNRSDKSFSLEDDGIRFGLTQVKYVGEAAAEEVIKKRPFASRQDFDVRVEAKKVNKRAKEALAVEGGFDNLGSEEGEDFADMMDRYDT